MASAKRIYCDKRDEELKDVVLFLELGTNWKGFWDTENLEAWRRPYRVGF